MGERIKPSEVRAKGSKREIKDILTAASSMHTACYNLGLPQNPAIMHEALVTKTQGLILQNPRPEDLKKARRS